MEKQTQLNSVLLRGIVGAVRVTNLSETSVLKMTLATNLVYKNGPEVTIETTWHQITAFESSRMSKDLFESLQKADHVEVKGRIRNVRYTDADGREHHNYEILATDIVKLESCPLMQGEEKEMEA